MKRLLILTLLVMVMVCGNVWAVGSSTLDLGSTMLYRGVSPIVFYGGASFDADTVASGGYLGLSFASRSVDLSALSDASCATFTIPTAGVLDAVVQLRTAAVDDSATRSLSIYLRVNSVDVALMNPARLYISPIQYQTTFRGRVRVNAGDRVEIVAYSRGGTFSIYSYISATDRSILWLSILP